MKIVSTVAALAAALLAWSPAAAQGLTPPAAPALEKADLDAWLDGLLPYAMSSGDIAGAVIVVVKDGQVLTERGYGYADIKSRRPVDPKTTLFRVGSISKPFTWTAVMQLVEQGKLDLDVDVNTYLDFNVPPFRGKPVTLRQLMTHTAGYEEHLKDLFTGENKRLVSLEQYVKAWQPARVFTPGEVPSYSNYGAALAGYVIERVSGQPFDAYVERHIFGPLGMSRSTFRQPLPKAFEADMASAYMRASGPSKPYELISARPAGSLSITGDDLAKFMIAQLDNGAYGGTRILQEETARRMHAEQAKIVPPLNAMALGFYREDRNGRGIIGHAGATEGFYADMHLLLDERVGLFVAMNSAGREVAASRIQRALFLNFMDRYYPSNAPRLPTAPTAKAHAKAMEGYYLGTRRMETSFFSVLNLLRQSKVTAGPDGTIMVDAIKAPSGAVKVWREVGPWLWEDETGQTRLSAVVKDGKVQFYATDGAPPVSIMQRLPPWEEAGWRLALVKPTLAVLALAVALWPLQAIVRRRYGQTFALSGKRAWLYRLTRIGALVQLLAFVACTQVMTKLSSGLTRLDDRLDLPMRGAQVLCLLGLVGTAVAAWNAGVVWRDPTASWWAKLSASAVLLASAVFAFFVLTLGVLSPTTEF